MGFNLDNYETVKDRITRFYADHIDGAIVTELVNNPESLIEFASANGIVAGVVSPLVMHSTVGLATASLLMLCIGLLSWTYIRHRWPEIGHNIAYG